MVSVARDYNRALLFDSTAPSRHRITEQLQSSPAHSELINPYITSIDDVTSGPYYFRVDSISASNARGLCELPSYKLPGVILLSLHKQNVGAFTTISTLLLEGNVHKRCPVICLVGTDDLKFYPKLQRAISVAEELGLSCAINWDSTHPELDAQAGLMSLCARLKRAVHRAMCADIAMSQATKIVINF